MGLSDFGIIGWSRKGSIPAEQGQSVDSRQVGWGLYYDEIAAKHQRGFEVSWVFVHGEADIHINIFLTAPW